MAAITIEKGDVILSKDGKQYRVLSTYYNGDTLSKIEGVDDNDPNRMRRSVFTHEIVRVMKKAPVVSPAVEEKSKKAGA